MSALRRWSKGAWLLHGWLIASVVLMPAAAPVQVLADDEEEWSFSHAEETYQLTVTGTPVPVLPGGLEAIQGEARHLTWEIWTSNLGNFETRSYNDAAATGVEVSWTVLSGDGQLASATSFTNGSGIATVDLLTGQADTEVQGAISDGNGGMTTSSATVTAMEVWSFDHNEALMSVELNYPGMGTMLAESTVVDVTATVREATWEVWTSSFGNTDTREYAEEVVQGADVTWTLEYGNGYLSPTSGITDAGGQTSTIYTMGPSAVGIRAEATYNGSTASASTTLEPLPPPPEQWTFSHNESALAGVTVAPLGGGTLLPGGTQAVTATVTMNTWEVWSGSYGGTTTANMQTIAATDVPVSFNILTGNGTVDPVSATTDSNGEAVTTFAMGTADSQLEVVAGDPVSDHVTATVTFGVVPESWSYASSDSGYAVDLTADGTVADVPEAAERNLTAEVLYSTWDIEQSNWGNTRTENVVTNPVANATVRYTVVTGDGTLTPATVTTDSNGLAVTAFTMGTLTTEVKAELLDVNEDVVTEDTLTLTAPPVEVFTYDRTEATVWATATVPEGQTDVASGAERTVNLQVSYESWEVWLGDQGHTDLRNPASGTANGASLAYSIVSGGGSVSPMSDSSTNASGEASALFMMGASASQMRIDVTFMGALASVELDFSSETFTLDGVESEVKVASTATGEQIQNLVTYQVRNRYLGSGGSIQYLTVSESPAMNALVTVSKVSGNGSITGTASGLADANGYFAAWYNAPDGPLNVKTTATYLNIAGESQTIAAPETGPALAIAGVPSGEGTVGVAYSGSFTATGGVGPYTWTKASGILPAGLMLSSSGTLTGTPTLAGTYVASMRVEDSHGALASVNHLMTIAIGGGGMLPEVYEPGTPPTYGTGDGGTYRDGSFVNWLGSSDFDVPPFAIQVATTRSNDSDPDPAWRNGKYVSATTKDPGEPDGWWEESCAMDVRKVNGEIEQESCTYPLQPGEEQVGPTYTVLGDYHPGPSGKEYWEFAVIKETAHLRLVANLEMPPESAPHRVEVEIIYTGENAPEDPPPQWLEVNSGTSSDAIEYEAPEGCTVRLRVKDGSVSYSGVGVSAQDAAGPRYRKVGLNGVPIPDSKPQVQNENGEPEEETYVDAYLRQLRHSVSDVYVTEESSLMPLMVRRDLTSAVWNYAGGLRPQEEVTTPFGPGWSSNICSYVRFDLPTGKRKAAVVVDEMGTQQRYQQFITKKDGQWKEVWVHTREEYRDVKTRQNSFVANPDGSAELPNNLGTLPKFKEIQLTKKFGTTCTYEMVPPAELYQIYSDSRVQESEGGTGHVYARLKEVEDRWGNKLEYKYADAGTLIPYLIVDPDRPGQQVLIVSENGLVKEVHGPGGDVTEYGYETKVAATVLDQTLAPASTTPISFLSTVTRGGATVSYDYLITQQTDPHSGESPPPPTEYYYANLVELTDERGGHYQFAYAPHETVYSTDSKGAVNRVYGVPYQLTGMSSPEIGTVTVSGEREVMPIVNATPLVYSEFSWGAGAEERTYRYEFTEPYVQNPAGLALLDEDMQSEEVTYTYQKLEIIAPDEESEIYEFEPEANFALKRVTDRNGLTTTFEYGDTDPDCYMALGGAVGAAMRVEAGGGKYDDPTKETDALGNVKLMYYHPNTRMLWKVKDARGVWTEYKIDAQGRRLSEAVYGGDLDGARLKRSIYGDGTFAGFVTAERLSPPLRVGDEGYNQGLGLLEDNDMQDPDGWFVSEEGSTTHYGPDVVVTRSLGTSPQAGWWRTLTETTESAAGTMSTKTVRDYAGNKRSVVVKQSEGVELVTNFEYDNKHRLVKVTHPDGHCKTLHYDLHGNLTKEVDEAGTVTFHQYDGLNRRIRTAVDLDGDEVAEDSRYTSMTVNDSTGVATYNGDLVTEVTYNSFNLPVDETDGNGVVTRHEYDAIGRRVKTTVNATDANAAKKLVTEYGYASTGDSHSGGTVFDVSGFKPTWVKDARGFETVITYDKLSREVKTVLEDTSVASGLARKIVTKKEYDAVGNVTKATQVWDWNNETDTNNRETVTRYDCQNRPVKVTKPDGTEVLTYYTPEGKPWYVKVSRTVGGDVFSTVNTTRYDSAGLAVEATAPAVRLQTGGVLVSPVTATEYDLAGNVVKVTDARGNFTETAYDLRNRPWKVTAPEVADALDGNEMKRPVTETTYDAVGRVTAVKDPLLKSSYKYYDRLGRVVMAKDPLGNKIVSTYDGNSNVLTVKDARGNTVTNTYDQLNRLIITVDAEGIENEFAYDKGGNRTSVKDGLDNETTFEYDALNRLTQERFANGNLTLHAYNAVHKVSETKKASAADASPRVVTYGYDKAERVTAVNYPLIQDGATTISAAYTRSLEYDAGGRLKKVSEGADRKDMTVEYTYNDLGWVLSESSRENLAAAPPSTPAQPTRKRTHQYRYDQNGNRRVAVLATGTAGVPASGISAERIIVTEHDALNRPEVIYDDNATPVTATPVSPTAATDDKTTSYGYDLAGRAVKLVNGLGQSTRNTYDDGGRLTKREVFTTSAQTTRLVSLSYQHDGNGNVTQQVESWTSPATTRSRTLTMTYDGANRLATETASETGTGALKARTTTHTYDDANNRTGKSVRESGTGAVNPVEALGDWVYAYNNANQLTQWTKTSVAGVPQRTVTLSYDGWGNRRQQQIATSGVANTSLRLGYTKYYWDAQDRLVKAGWGTTAAASGATFSWEYDYRTRRIGLVTPAVTALGSPTDQPGATAGHVAFIFSGGLSVAEHARSGTNPAGLPLDATPDVTFVRGADMGGGVGGLLYSQRGLPSVAPKYEVSNGRGDIVAQSQAATTFTWTASYETAGKRVKTTGAANANPDRQRGNSKDEDTVLGLLNEGFRYRDTETMVWLSRDPAGFVDGPNLYAYVKQNAWSKFDPHGLAGVVAKFSKALKAAKKTLREKKTFNGRGLRNGSFAGTTKTWEDMGETGKVLREKYGNKGKGVRFTEEGLADFSDFAKQLPGGGKNLKFAEGALKTNKENFVSQAREKLKEMGLNDKQIAQLEKDHVWDHGADGCSLQLVPQDLHSAVGHHGGSTLIEMARTLWNNKGAAAVAVGSTLFPEVSKGATFEDKARGAIEDVLDLVAPMGVVKTGEKVELNIETISGGLIERINQ